MDKSIVSLQSLEEEISKGKKHGLIGALQIGRSLDKIQDGNLWMPTGCKSFWKYAEQVHGFGRSTTYNLCAVYRTFGEKILQNQELQSIEPTRLIRLLPYTTESNCVGLLHQAAMIPDVAGFDANLRNLQKKIAPDQCNHPEGFVPVGYEVCKICGQRRKCK